MMQPELVDLFKDTQFQWGLRGDPYLWAALRERFDGVDWPISAEQFHSDLKTAFSELTGHSVDAETHFAVEKFNHGGMSGGMISPEFWRKIGFPILLKSYRIAQWRVDHALEKLAD